jgi:hypothetical protein
MGKSIPATIKKVGVRFYGIFETKNRREGSLSEALFHALCLKGTQRIFVLKQITAKSRWTAIIK